MGSESETAVAEEVPALEAEPLEQVDEVVETLPVDEPEQVEISIGGESPPVEEEEKPHIRELRQRYRELQKRNRTLEDQAAKVETPAAPDVGTKPTLEGCGYDEEKFEQDFTSWQERTRTVAEVQRKKQQGEQASKDAWQAKMDQYQTAAKALKVPDFTDAEDELKARLSPTQQGLIVHVTEHPEHVAYALGKSPKEAERLAAITDPAKYAYELGKLESKMTVTPRKAPPPETKVVGSAARTSGSDKELDRLRAEADKTGNRTAVGKYLRERAAKT